MKPKILATQWVPDEVKEAFAPKAELISPDKEKIAFSKAQVLQLLPDFDGLFTIFFAADRAVIDAGTKLKTIANLGVGFDSIDVSYATEKHIAVINTPQSVTEGTAELTIALMMDTMRNIAAYDRFVRAGHWVTGAFEAAGTELYGRKIGVCGFGRIGRAVGKKAQALGMQLYYYDPFRLSEADEAALGATYLPFTDLLRQCDCISLHMPYTPENHHLICRDTLSLMKPEAYLINAARGPVVKESDLVWALQNGIIRGAGLDVFETEPVISDALKACPNVVMTPHIGTQTYGIRVAMCHEALQGMTAIFAGERPYNLVNGQVVL